MSTPLWTAFVAFCETTTRCAREHLSGQVALEPLLAVLTTVSASPPADAEPVLRRFFEQPPSHVAAVNGLDHTLFVGDVVFPTCSLSLREVLAQFCKIPAAYSAVWLALLDVAEQANPQGVQAAASRNYIQQQMGALGRLPEPSTNQLEGVLGNVLGAIPGLQDCMNQILATRDGAPGADFEATMTNLKEKFMDPMLANMRASNPGAPDLEPALTQIFAGFRGLNAALANNTTTMET